MSQFDSYQPTYGQPVEQKPRGHSKLLLGILIGCGTMILLCCGGVIGLGFFMQRWATQALEDDPAAIRDQTTAIAKIDIPESLEPQVAIHVSLPFMGELANIAVYGNSKKDAALILADVNKQITQGRSVELWVEEMQTNTQQGTTLSDRNLEDIKTESSQHTIRGSDVSFTIQTGKPKGSDTLRIIAKGSFPGKLGEGFFWMAGDAETFTIDDIKQVIQSIE